VTDDKIYCVYIAPDEATVREHAKQGGFPANRVSEVKGIIDPTTAEACPSLSRFAPRAGGGSASYVRHLDDRMKSCPYCGGQYPDDAVVCPIDGNTLNSTTESQSAVSGAPLASVICPACGTLDDFTRTIELRGSFSWAVFFFGGIFAVLFRNAGRKRKVRCNKCETLFDIRSPLARVSLVIFWLLICPTIVALLILVITFLHSIFSH